MISNGVMYNAEKVAFVGVKKQRFWDHIKRRKGLCEDGWEGIYIGGCGGICVGGRDRNVQVDGRNMCKWIRSQMQEQKMDVTEFTERTRGMTLMWGTRWVGGE